MVPQSKNKKKILQKILIGASEKEISSAIQQWKINSTVCAETIQDESYFKCLDCSSEESHCICSKCFYNGNHEGHCYQYFNNGGGGICDCGDPNLEKVINCKDHGGFSEKALNDAENLIIPLHKKQIEVYFSTEFEKVFQNFEQFQYYQSVNSFKHSLVELDEMQVEDDNKIIQQDLKEDKNYVKGKLKNGKSHEEMMDILFDEINAFIEDNPGGCLILSKVIMKPTSNFRCNHLCSLIADEQKFDKFSKNKRRCTCSIMLNILRYISCYSKELEFKMQGTLCRFFSNQYFRIQLIQVYSQMMHFLVADFIPGKSNFYQIFCQFNSFSIPGIQSSVVIECPLFLSTLQKLLDSNEKEYLKNIYKSELFFSNLSFFISNDLSQQLEAKSNLVIQILKAISSSTKSKNFGVYFLYRRMDMDRLFMHLVEEIFNLIQTLAVPTKTRIMGEIISAMLDQIVLLRKKDLLLQENLKNLNECIELETKILNFLKQNANNKAIQYYVKTNLSNIVIEYTIQEGDEKGVSIERIITYKDELLSALDKLQEIVKQNIQKNKIKAFHKVKINENLALERVFICWDNKFELNRLTSKLGFSELNQSPLFNNQYKILALAFSHFYLQENSISEAKKLIIQLLDSEHQAIFEDILLFSVNQLSQTMEYVRNHSEKIMGFNDYEAIQQRLPGRDSDLVVIQSIYMAVEYNLFDLDILAFQTILPLVDTDKFFRELFSGFQLPIEEIDICKIDGDQVLKVKRYTKALEWILIILLDIVSFVNSMEFSKNGPQKWVQGYIDQIINICFQFSSSYTLQTLKNKLKSLKVNGEIEVKHSLLSIAKIEENKFTRQEDKKFTFEPMIFLREKQAHNNYCQLLNEKKQGHPEIEYIVGNQFPQLIQNSQFAKEIANQVCSSKVVGNAFMNIIKSIITLASKKQYDKGIQYSLKYLSILLQLGQTRTDNSGQLTRFFAEDAILQNYFSTLKSIKELSKSAIQVENEWFSVKQTYENEDTSTNSTNSSSIIMTQYDQMEENQAKDIFMKKAKEAQQRSLQLILQKQQKFYERNEKAMTESQEIKLQDFNCLFCHGSQNSSLEIIQAYFETDNLDLYSNKTGRIPIGLKQKHIISACSHISHFNCQNKNRRISLGRMPYGQLCIQCKFLYNIYLPYLEPLLQQSIEFKQIENVGDKSKLTFEKEVDQQKNKDLIISEESEDIEQEKQIKIDGEEEKDNGSEKLLEIEEEEIVKVKIQEGLINQSEFSVLLTSKQLKREDEDKVIEAVTDFLNKMGKIQTFSIKAIQECICNILSDVFDSGLQKFFNKTKILSVNLFLVGRAILHDILTDLQKEKVIQYLENLVQKNISVLSNINQFIRQFVYEDTNTLENHSYQDLPMLYVQTIIYLALIPEMQSDQSIAAAKILQLSEGVFKYACICNSAVILTKSFSENQQKNDLMQNSEFIESLNGQNQQWKDLITATLLTIYQFPQQEFLKEKICLNKIEESSNLELIQLDMLPFLKITPEIINTAIQIISNENEKQNQNQIWMGTIKCLESIKYSFCEVGSDYLENYNKFFYKKCSNCDLFPKIRKSHLHLCLICGIQMCSISCSSNKNRIQKDKNLTSHAESMHEGKAIFLNTVKNSILFINSPFSAIEDSLYFDSINKPILMSYDTFFLQKTWSDYKLNKQKLKHLREILLKRQLPNKVSSILSSQNLIVESEM